MLLAQSWGGDQGGRGGLTYRVPVRWPWTDRLSFSRILSKKKPEMTPEKSSSWTQSI